MLALDHHPDHLADSVTTLSSNASQLSQGLLNSPAAVALQG